MTTLDDDVIVTTREGCVVVEGAGGWHGNSRGRGSNQGFRRVGWSDLSPSSTDSRSTQDLGGSRLSAVREREREGGREGGRGRRRGREGGRERRGGREGGREGGRGGGGREGGRERERGREGGREEGGRERGSNYGNNDVMITSLMVCRTSS